MAAWTDGSRTSAEKITDWGRDDAQPKLDSRNLLTGTPAIRWMRDNRKSVANDHSAYIEFVGGDRLPGRVIGYSDGQDDSQASQPSHLLVTDAKSSASVGATLRITPRWLERVVWQQVPAARYRPSTIFYRDGSRADFRAVRWTSLGVRFLFEHGSTLVSFDQIAELHLPRVDPWGAHFDQLAQLNPTAGARLLTIETSHGLRATCVEGEFHVRPSADFANSSKWTYEMQPAWLVDKLTVHFADIRQWTWFGIDEVPLTRIEPRACVQRSSLAGSWKSWRVDASVQGTPLHTGNHDYGWGFGVHAHNELEFSLPPQARIFSTVLALDRAAGSAGCVRGRIIIETEREPVRYESPAIVGSQHEPRSAELNIPRSSAQENRLILIADAAETDRPAGSDPLDIRDTFDWLEPLVKFDRSLVQAELRARLPAAVSSQASRTPPR